MATSTAIAGIIWLGGSIVRAALAFDLFVPGTLVFKTTMSNDAVLQTIRLCGITAFYTMTSYAIFILFGAILWILHRRLWKLYGAVFIAGVLFLLYVPVESVQMWYDVRLVMMIQNNELHTATLEIAKSLLVKRISVLNGAPLLAMLGYLSAIAVLITQPLTKTVSSGGKFDGYGVSATTDLQQRQYTAPDTASLRSLQ